MFHSARACLAIEESTVLDKMYIGRNVKHQAIAHFLEYRELLVDEVEEAIKEEYGRVDSEYGPFSIQEYLHWMAKPREYGDLIMIKLIASLWGCRITVLRSDSLAELRFRHDLPLEDADMVWVYNSQPIHGHYSPAICVKEGKAETLEIFEKFIRARGYDPEVDRLERKALKLWRWKEGSDYKDLISSESDEEALKEASEEARKKKKGSAGKEEDESKKMLEKLKRKVEELEKKCEVVEKIKELVGGGEVEEEGDGGEKGVKRRRGFERASQVQEVSKGETVCNVCKKDCTSTRNLKRHIDQFHKREYRYYCQPCNRGFMRKVGYNQHLETHKQDTEKLACREPGCKSVFTTDKNRKKHEKLHTLKEKIRCQHKGCSYSHKAKDYVLQHEKICKYNLDKEELKCDVCGKGGFYLPKKVSEHKRLEHNW